VWTSVEGVGGKDNDGPQGPEPAIITALERLFRPKLRRSKDQGSSMSSKESLRSRAACGWGKAVVVE